MLEYFIRSQMESRGYVPIKKDDLERERDIWQQERKDFFLKLKKLVKELDALRAENTRLLEELDSIRVERTRLLEELDSIRVERTRLLEELDSIRVERTRLLEELDALRAERTRLLEKLDSMENEREELLRDGNFVRGELNTQREARERILSEIENLKHDKFNALLRTPEEAARFMNTFVQGVLRKHHRSVFWGDRLMTMDKTMGFWEGERFRESYMQIKESQVYDQYSGPDGISWRLHTLVWAANCAMELPGDFIECGVFKGDMSWVVCNTVNFAESDKIFYLYDTFEGFSDKYSSEDDFPCNPNFLDFANKEYRIPNLYTQVVKRFTGFSNVKVIKGVLPDVLNMGSPEKIAFLHVDLNSPAAEIGTLEVLFDRIVTGGMVIFDDYGWFEYVKQKRAEDAFMNDRGYTVLELPTGQGLVVKR